MMGLNKYGMCIALMLYSLMFLSCEEVIEIKYDNIPEKVVIEAILTDLDTRHIVNLSLTKDMEAANKIYPLLGATVVLREENGRTITFIDQNKNGNYYSTRFKAIPGRKYTLAVTTNGTTYTASSIMPGVVPIKTIQQIEVEILGEMRKLVQLQYNDPPNQENYYYSKLYVNNKKRSSLNVQSDRFNDGKEVKTTIFFDDPKLEIGDKVKIQLLTIDAQVYKYLFSLAQIAGNSGAPTTPANPLSNFNNGALGYFSASTITTDSLTIK